MATSGFAYSSPPKRQRVAAEAPPPATTGTRTDMLMALPSDILNDRILVLFPFDKLVRTSCLSRAWRRRWESIAKLHTVSSSRALWWCAAPVLGFRARVARRDVSTAPSDGSAPWRGRASRSSAWSSRKPRRLPGPALFSCTAIVHLHLEVCDIPAAPPCFPGFPNLERLHLVDVTLPFTRAGTQLEDLIVAAENLAVLDFVKPVWRRRGHVGHQSAQPPVRHDMLEGITCKFENLREASLNIDFGQLPSIDSLLKFAPHIEHLAIMTLHTESDKEKIDKNSLNSEISSDLFASIKHVSLTGAKSSKHHANQMCFMKFALFKHSVTFMFDDDDERSEWFGDSWRELMECQKASPQLVLTAKLTQDGSLI
uniref:F-box domain-containing protein n=1 Tax=Oryza punctata TaxID=4537 RepID=A0A0E0LT29_ORYPU